MKGYSETNIFNDDDKALFERARWAVSVLPDPEDGVGPWRCHEVARAVARALDSGTLPLRVVDGQSAGGQHTWIAYRGPEPLGGRTRILDVYSIGRLPQVQLVDPSWCRTLGYVPGHLPRTDVDEEIAGFLLGSIRSAERRA